MVMIFKRVRMKELRAAVEAQQRVIGRVTTLLDEYERGRYISKFYIHRLKKTLFPEPEPPHAQPRGEE